VEEGDYEDKNPFSKQFEKNYEKGLLYDKPENSVLNRTTQMTDIPQLGLHPINSVSVI